MQKTLIAIGIITILAGITWPYIAKLDLGRLPGDIQIKRENFSLFFPITTSIIISSVISAIMFLVNWMGKR